GVYLQFLAAIRWTSITLTLRATRPCWRPAQFLVEERFASRKTGGSRSKASAFSGLMKTRRGIFSRTRLSLRKRWSFAAWQFSEELKSRIDADICTPFLDSSAGLCCPSLPV